MENDIEVLPQNSESGFFSFRIHEGNSCAGTGFHQTGSRYNPDGAAKKRWRMTGKKRQILSYDTDGCEGET